MKKLISLLLVLAMMLGLAACGSGSSSTSGSGSSSSGQASGSSDADVIKIGLNEAFTGGNAAFGELETRGVDLAYKYRDTVLGKKVEIIKADNKTDKVEAATVSTKLIDSDGVVAVLGAAGSGVTMASAEVLAEKKIVGMAATATNPNVTLGNPWQFRVCFIDTYQGQVMAQYAYNCGYKKIAILRELTNDFCVGLASYFTDTFVKLTGDSSSVVTADFQQGDQDFSSQISALTAANPDAIFLPVPTNVGDTAVFAKQLHQLGHQLPILSSDGTEVPDLITVGGKDVEDIYYSTFFDTSMSATTGTTKFLEQYAETYGKDAIPSSFEVLGYDTYMIILDAIEAAGSTDSEAIQKALWDMKDWPGAGGYVTFDENNNPNKPAVIKVIKDGAFQYVTTVQLDPSLAE